MREIVKQPNGKFSVWSTIVDHFVASNLDRDGVLKFYEEVKERSLEDDERERILKKIDELNAAEEEYNKFVADFQRKCAWIKCMQGDMEFQKFKDYYGYSDFVFEHDERSVFSIEMTKIKKEAGNR